jgi:uncharacterized repeat protein (TIGR03803 family)
LDGFDGSDGDGPVGSLTQDSLGNLWGTTIVGGVDAQGTIFKVTIDGTLSTIYSFCAEPNCNDGAESYAGLLQATDGNFYGTTSFHGTFVGGTVYKITASGQLTTLYSFCAQPNCLDGKAPQGALIQAPDGALYGTTPLGGASDSGTVFKIVAGRLSTLYSFTDSEDGGFPLSGLLLATDGNLYGTTHGGGVNDAGTVFKVTTDGALTTLYSFCAQPECADGANPQGSLNEAASGIFYGTTTGGGDPSCDGGCGTVFSLDTGLVPFVAFVRPYGKVRQNGGILGQGFTGTTSVSLNGIPANFTVVSDTFIKATVPAGATTGYVTVSTPTGVLNSNVPFRVIP